MTGTRHWEPGELERVTVDSVRAGLDRAGCRRVAVLPVRAGVVRVVVAGWTRRRRTAARRAVFVALRRQHEDECWRLVPGAPASWRQACRSWVTVRDAGLDWFDEQGRDYLEHLAAQP
jgi:hypothetical protein